jgi:type IV fimbrial biogenesis protein FimT
MSGQRHLPPRFRALAPGESPTPSNARTAAPRGDPAQSIRRMSNGVTLVEIAVALAVVATLSTLGASGFGTLLGRARATSDANDLLNGLELTRAEAAKRARRVTMLPANGDWSNGWTVFVDLDANRRVDPGEPVVLVHPALARTTRVVTNTTPGYIAFAASGMPQQYNGGFLAATIELCDTGTSRSIVLAKTGRPRVVIGSC